MTPAIISISTAVPKTRIPQNEVVEFMAKAHGFSGREMTRLRALYRASGIGNRYTVIPDYARTNPNDFSFFPNNEYLDPFPSTSARGVLYRKEAINLSEEAVLKSIQESTFEKEEITHLITISCTGMYAPGLDIDLVNKIGLNKTVQRTSINFMGCYAAFVGLKQAHAICSSDPKAKVLIVATELCTLHFQKADDEDNLVANALFGDGSAAVIVGTEATGNKPKLALHSFYNELIPEGANEMAWEIGDFGYEMKLSTYVPDLIEKGIGSLVASLKQQSSIDHFDHYAIHPGGKRILEVIEKELQIQKKDNWPGHEVLQQYGNMSSPTVLFTIDALRRKLDTSNKGENILSLAFGPGLTIESMILKIS